MMRRLILATALAGSGLLFGLTGANAQVDDKPDKPDGPALEAPDTSGMTERSGRSGQGFSDEADARTPQYPGGCGTYHFWNGERCVDARTGR